MTAGGKVSSVIVSSSGRTVIVLGANNNFVSVEVPKLISSSSLFSNLKIRRFLFPINFVSASSSVTLLIFQNR